MKKPDKTLSDRVLERKISSSAVGLFSSNKPATLFPTTATLRTAVANIRKMPIQCNSTTPLETIQLSSTSNEAFDELKSRRFRAFSFSETFDQSTITSQYHNNSVVKRNSAMRLQCALYSSVFLPHHNQNIFKTSQLRLEYIS